MSEPTLVVTPGEIAGSELTVEGDAYRHLFRSLRLASGDPLRVVDGEGTARRGRIQSVDGHRAKVLLGDAAPAREALRPLEFFVALPRPERASWLVEKLTELGSPPNCWVTSERAPRESGKGTLERHRRVAVAALEQSGGAWLPQIEGPMAWPGRSTPARPGRWCWIRPGRPNSRAPAACGPGSVPKEALPPASGPTWNRGSVSFSLGCRILRIETAALAAAVRLLAP